MNLDHMGAGALDVGFQNALSSPRGLWNAISYFGPIGIGIALLLFSGIAYLLYRIAR